MAQIGSGHDFGQATNIKQGLNKRTVPQLSTAYIFAQGILGQTWMLSPARACVAAHWREQVDNRRHSFFLVQGTALRTHTQSFHCFLDRHLCLLPPLSFWRSSKWRKISSVDWLLDVWEYLSASDNSRTSVEKECKRVQESMPRQYFGLNQEDYYTVAAWRMCSKWLCFALPYPQFKSWYLPNASMLRLSLLSRVRWVAALTWFGAEPMMEVDGLG